MLTKQSGPLSPIAHALMCKPLVNSAAASRPPGATCMCVCVCVGGREVGLRLNCLRWHLSFITGWQQEWEASRQSDGLYQGQP